MTGALEFINTKSPSKAIQLSYDKYIPSLYNRTTARGVLGKVVITPDMVRNTMVPREDIPDALSIINNKIKGSKIMLEPSSLNTLAVTSGYESWKAVPADEKTDIMKNQTEAIYVTVATDGTLSAFSSITQSPVKFKVGVMSQYSYHMKPDQIGYSATRVERRKARIEADIARIPKAGIRGITIE